jgi:hypothetical protein
VERQAIDGAEQIKNQAWRFGNRGSI